MIAGGFAQQGARGDFREIDAAAHLQLEPVVRRAADGAVAVPVVAREEGPEGATAYRWRSGSPYTRPPSVSPT